MKNFDIEDPITKLNQVSAKRGEVLIANKISTLKDLLYYFPRKHLDRSNITKIKDIQTGNKYNIVGKVETCGEKKTRYKKLYQVIVSDGTGILTLTWFNSSTYIKRLVKKGDQIASIGTKEENGGWNPHLHFQLSYIEPHTHDLPGVVSKEKFEWARRVFPDPRMVLGQLYWSHVSSYPSLLSSWEEITISWQEEMNTPSTL